MVLVLISILKYRRDNLLMVPSQPDLNSLLDNDAENNGDLSINTKIVNNKLVSIANFKRDFDLGDVLDYMKTGFACIIEDEVTQRFVPEELKIWNLMTRTNKNFQFINWRTTCLWIFGCWFRYCLLFPARLVVLLIGVGLVILIFCITDSVFTLISCPFWSCPAFA